MEYVPDRDTIEDGPLPRTFWTECWSMILSLSISRCGIATGCDKTLWVIEQKQEQPAVSWGAVTRHKFLAVNGQPDR